MSNEPKSNPEAKPSVKPSNGCLPMKEALELVWNNVGCLMPNHIIRWNVEEFGFSFVGKYGLYYTPGRRMAPKNKNRKGGGSFLVKGYGLASRFGWAHEEGFRRGLWFHAEER